MNDDLLVIGGGAAAFAAATKARDLGVPVTMIQDDRLPLGGTCVNVGCVPSKFMLEATRRYAMAKQGSDWWPGVDATLDLAGLIQAKDGLVTNVRRQNYDEVVEALGDIQVVSGRGRLVGAQAVEVSGETFDAARIIIATGARTRMDTVGGLVAADPLTHVTALGLEALPGSIAVLGGGPLGLEFAQIFARAGGPQTKVHVVGRVLPHDEEELAPVLRRALERDGITFHETRATKVERHQGLIQIHSDDEVVAEVDEILAATGIQPNTESLGTDAAGVVTDVRGYVQVDDTMRTSARGIYAAGDVTGRRPLETVAAKEGHHAASNLLAGTSLTIDYDRVPHAVFTEPEVASVGWTERRQMDELGACSCRTVPFEHVPRALAAGDTTGHATLVAHPDTGVIMGAHVVGPQASELIHLPLYAIHAGMSVQDLVDIVHVFPSRAEVWKTAALSFSRDISKMSCCIV